MASDDTKTTVSLASVARALWALQHETDPAWFNGLVPGHERAQYKRMAAQLLRLAATD